MSAETDPFERVWLNPNRPDVLHRSAGCATQTADPIPSFQAFAEAARVDRCGVCFGERAPAVPDDVPVGEDLREVRETLGLTQDDVAERLGLSDGAAVSSWECERRRPSRERRDALRELAVEAEDVDEEGACKDIGEDESGALCLDCGQRFESGRALSNHLAKTSCSCERCDRLETHTLEWSVHRTEDHGCSMHRLDYLDPGEFEDLVADAESTADLREALGWENQRLFRTLHAYGLSDVVGPSDPDLADVDAGDDSWKRLYQDVATDGGAR